jgi:hypothetical protein
MAVTLTPLVARRKFGLQHAPQRKARTRNLPSHFALLRDYLPWVIADDHAVTAVPAA